MKWNNAPSLPVPEDSPWTKWWAWHTVTVKSTYNSTDRRFNKTYLKWEWCERSRHYYCDSYDNKIHSYWKYREINKGE